MLSAGTLRHRVTIQTRTETTSGRQVTETWASVRTRVAALVKPLSGRDLERGRQVDPRASHEVRLRYWQDYRTDLDGGRARFVWHDGEENNRTLEIVEPPRETEHRVALDMICREAA